MFFSFFPIWFWFSTSKSMFFLLFVFFLFFILFLLFVLIIVGSVQSMAHSNCYSLYVVVRTCLITSKIPRKWWWNKLTKKKHNTKWKKKKKPCLQYATTFIWLVFNVNALHWNLRYDSKKPLKKSHGFHHLAPEESVDSRNTHKTIHRRTKRAH